MAEAILWTELKASKLGGHKFVRQMPIGPYFADFVCRSAKLVVEPDGSQHADSAYDRRRDDFMRAEGFGRTILERRHFEEPCGYLRNHPCCPRRAVERGYAYLGFAVRFAEASEKMKGSIG